MIALPFSQSLLFRCNTISPGIGFDASLSLPLPTNSLLDGTFSPIVISEVTFGYVFFLYAMCFVTTRQFALLYRLMETKVLY